MTDVAAFTADFHDHFTRDPNRCVQLGVDRRLDELPDPSLHEYESRVGEARDLVKRIDTLARSPLSFDDGLDLHLARNMLESEIHDETYTYNGRTQRQQLPTAAIDVGDSLFMMFVNDPRLFRKGFRRFLENRFRASLPFAEIPLRIIYKRRRSIFAKRDHT